MSVLRPKRASRRQWLKVVYSQNYGLLRPPGSFKSLFIRFAVWVVQPALGTIATDWQVLYFSPVIADPSIA